MKETLSELSDQRATQLILKTDLKKILIICTGNSCRSIMLEAFINQYGNDYFKAYSAGSMPNGVVHPMSIMTIKNSPLRNLPPQLGLMVFSILSIMWSGIFAAIINNPYAFGVSAGGHLLVVFGIFITAIVYDSAEKYTAPQNYNSRATGGEHE